MPRVDKAAVCVSMSVAGSRFSSESAYLGDVITKIADGHLNSRIEELPPWADAEQALRECGLQTALTLPLSPWDRIVRLLIRRGSPLRRHCVQCVFEPEYVSEKIELS